MVPTGCPHGFSLIFDVDDTLWDSNTHFLEAETFLGIMSLLGIGDHAIRAVIRRHELDIIAESGDGRRPYVLALHRTMRELLPPTHSGSLTLGTGIRRA